MGKSSKRHGAPPPPPLLAPFLEELSAQLRESVGDVTGEVENGMHQKLVSNGNKQQQARQLNVVVKSSSAYMKKVQAVFEKNFDKFELYVRRNIVAVPADVAAEVAQLRSAQAPGTRGGSGSGSLGGGLDDPSLSAEEQQERRALAQIEALHRRVRELKEENQRLELDRQALDARARRFREVAAKVSFLEDAPRETVAPMKRAAEHISSLRESFQHMDDIQTQIEEDTQQFKRQKLATRASFRNLRKRYMARTAAMSFRSADDLKDLHAKLLTL